MLTRKYTDGKEFFDVSFKDDGTVDEVYWSPVNDGKGAKKQVSLISVRLNGDWHKWSEKSMDEVFKLDADTNVVSL
jgi:hypothetical protein